MINCLYLYLPLHKTEVNYERPHCGKYCYGKTPMQTFEDSKRLALEKNNEILYLEHMADQKSQNLNDTMVA